MNHLSPSKDRSLRPDFRRMPRSNSFRDKLGRHIPGHEIKNARDQAIARGDARSGSSHGTCTNLCRVHHSERRRSLLRGCVFGRKLKLRVSGYCSAYWETSMTKIRGIHLSFEPMVLLISAVNMKKKDGLAPISAKGPFRRVLPSAFGTRTKTNTFIA
jgi:hypothetical protein